MSRSLIACLGIPDFALQIAVQRVGIHPEIPVVIANGTSDRAMVVDVSPTARTQGVRRGMLVWAARRQCRWLRIIADDVDATTAAMEQVRTVLTRHTDSIAVDGPGRWLMSLTALGNAFGQAADIAKDIIAEVRRETGYHAVIGLAAQPVVAKIAAERATSGCMVVLPGTEAAFLSPLPVVALPGIGTKTEAALERLGVTTIGQLADVPPGMLTKVCGTRAAQLIRAARGLPPSDATATETISVSWHSRDEAVIDPHVLHAEVYALTEQVGRALRERGTATGLLAVDVTWSDGIRRRENVSWPRRCDLDRVLAAGSHTALERLLAGRRIAIVGMTVTASDLGAIQQDLLADDDSRVRDIQTALDAIKRRYGAQAILPARILGMRVAA